MGRPAAPAGLKLLNGRSEGRDSGGRLVSPPPLFVREAPEPPEWLSVEARAEWDRVAPGLERLDLLKPEDRAVFTAYCETWSRFVQATRAVQADGLQVVNHSTRKDGSTSEWVTKNPAVGIAETAAAHLKSLGGEFGLTPASERHLSPVAPEDPAGDPFSG
jgi:P27 family predicted phage terminase small subunit